MRRKGGQQRRITKLVFSSFLLTACNNNSSTDLVAISPYYPTKLANLKFFITDKPLKDVAKVNVNIDHLELLLERGGKQARIKIAENIGEINLLDFRNGVLLGVSDIAIPEDVSVKQIRIILKESGHEVIHTDNSVCPLKTPSAQKSGVKILLKNPIIFENNKSYAMVVDFDAEKSVVQNANGCLLKPVLKLISATSVPSQSVDEDGNSSEAPDTLADGTDGNDTSNDDGYDITYPENMTPVIEPGYDPIVSYFF